MRSGSCKAPLFNSYRYTFISCSSRSIRVCRDRGCIVLAQKARLTRRPRNPPRIHVSLPLQDVPPRVSTARGSLLDQRARRDKCSPHIHLIKRANALQTTTFAPFRPSAYYISPPELIVSLALANQSYTTLQPPRPISALYLPTCKSPPPSLSSFLFHSSPHDERSPRV